jgi:hypothetical protein
VRHIFGKNERTTYLRRTDLKFCQNLIVLIIIQDSTHDAGMSKRRYLHQYATHSAWLEDSRRTDNSTLAKLVLPNAMDTPVSHNWKGYWQRAA